MHVDVVRLRDFYASALGRVVRISFNRIIKKQWSIHAEEVVVGFGYAVPVLDDIKRQSASTFAFMPSKQGVLHWPGDSINDATLVDELAWPLTDASVDRLIVLHGLEMSRHPADLMREMWRVLKPNGRIIMIVPYRSGLWARSDKTPFGSGHPYSKLQLLHLMREECFVPLLMRTALPLPPSRSRLMIELFRAIDQVSFLRPIGRFLGRIFGGVIIVEATKQLYAPRLLKAKKPGHEFIPLPQAPAPLG